MRAESRLAGLVMDYLLDAGTCIDVTNRRAAWWAAEKAPQRSRGAARLLRLSGRALDTPAHG
jgi:hypothetical protein